MSIVISPIPTFGLLLLDITNIMTIRFPCQIQASRKLYHRNWTITWGITLDIPIEEILNQCSNAEISHLIMISSVDLHWFFTNWKPWTVSIALERIIIMNLALAIDLRVVLFSPLPVFLQKLRQKFSTVVDPTNKY